MGLAHVDEYKSWAYVQLEDHKKKRYRAEAKAELLELENRKLQTDLKNLTEKHTGLGLGLGLGLGPTPKRKPKRKPTQPNFHLGTQEGYYMWMRFGIVSRSSCSAQKHRR